jgi:hypothetical protein
MAAVWLGFHGGTTELEGVKVWGTPGRVAAEAL